MEPIPVGGDLGVPLAEQATAVARFGQLERVPATAGWMNEPADFTPWLSANLDGLGSELGLTLTLKKREYAIGRYSLDLLLEDTNQRVVIVENQFGQTDHTHLGQLLTYCAGAKAEVVVWLAERFTEEHIAALEWLNESTVSGVGFFGVELELLRIGASPLAPHFRVVVKPNEWVKRVRPEAPELVDWDWDSYATKLGVALRKIEVGHSLVEHMNDVLATRGVQLTWAFRKGYIPLQRPGGYNVMVVDIYFNRNVRFAVKLPAAPEDLGLTNPYPHLEARWAPGDREWGWMVGGVAEIPDVTAAVDLALHYLPSQDAGATAAGGSGPSHRSTDGRGGVD